MTKLEELRKKAGYTQADLAAKSGISRTTIGKIERDTVKWTRSDVLIALADALGCNVSDFLCAECQAK